MPDLHSPCELDGLSQSAVHDHSLRQESPQEFVESSCGLGRPVQSRSSQDDAVGCYVGRQIVSEGAKMVVGTGVAGGLSTFQSFGYGVVVLMSASTASARRRAGLCRDQSGAGLQTVGLKLSGQGSA